MVVLLSQGHIVRKVAIVKDRVCIVNVEKVVLPQRCILQIGKLGI